jgi:hypothetical protein
MPMVGATVEVGSMCSTSTGSGSSVTLQFMSEFARLNRHVARLLEHRWNTHKPGICRSIKPNIDGHVEHGERA